MTTPSASEHKGDARPNPLVHLYVRDIDAASQEFGIPVDEGGLAGGVRFGKSGRHGVGGPAEGERDAEKRILRMPATPSFETLDGAARGFADVPVAVLDRADENLQHENHRRPWGKRRR